MCQAIARELEGIELGDERLNARAGRLLETLAADPAASINAACGGWSETQAAYRFFNNQRVEPEKLLRPHREATERRIDEQAVVLFVQDTTELDYSNHPAEGVGLLNRPQRRGFYDHSHIAFTPERLCLGVVDVEFFSRTAESLGKTEEREHAPIEEKESFRWLKGYRLACEVAERHPETQIVSVADSEADIYELLVKIAEQPTQADFVIRAKYDRCLPERDPTQGPHVHRKVRQELAETPPVTTRVIDLPQTPKRPARQATLELRAKEIVLKPPHGRGPLGEMTLRMVHVQEVDPPDDGTAVDWLLITSLPIDSVEAVLKVADYYTARWPIEVYFRTFKTGCRVEEVQLETADRLLSCLMLYKIIAWRVMYLTYLGRECPELPCTAVFADVEWQPTWQVARQEGPPKTPPTLNEFINVLAELGGYNNRPDDPPPGPQAIWTGIRRMTDFALAWKSFQNNAKVVCK